MTASATLPAPPAQIPDAALARWPKRKILPMLGLLAVFYAFPVGMMPLYVGPSETAYVFPAIALYERGETRIDAEVKRYWKHEDIVEHRKHYYSNKAPGFILPLVAAAPIVDVLVPGRLRMIELIYFGRLLALILPFVCFLYLLGRTLERLSRPTIAWGLTLAYALATAASVYSTMLYTHNFAALLHGTALILLMKPSGRRALLAGFLAGYGTITEHLTLVLFGCLAVAAFLGAERSERLKIPALFLVGSVPAFAIFFGYNWVSFDDPFTFSYQFDRFLKTAATTQRRFGARELTFWSLYGLTLSPSRGFVFYTPWMAFAAATVSCIWKQTAGRLRLFLLGTQAAFALMLVALAMYVGWPAGVSVGPRYLVAAYPFLLFPLAWWLGTLPARRYPGVRAALLAMIGLSLTIHLVAILAYPMTPWVVQVPFVNSITLYCLDYLRNGMGTYTVVNHFGVSIPISRALLVGLCLSAAAAYAWAARESLTRKSACVILACVVGGAGLFLPWSKIGVRDEKILRDSVKFYRNYLYGYNRNTKPIRGW